MAKIFLAFGGRDFSTSAAVMSVPCDLHSQRQQAGSFRNRWLATTDHHQVMSLQPNRHTVQCIHQTDQDKTTKVSQTEDRAYLPPASKDGARASASSRVYGSKFVTSCSSQLNLPAEALQ